jgi:hypothetical protein
MPVELSVATSATVLVPCGVWPAGADDVPGVSVPGTIVPGGIGFGVTTPCGNAPVEIAPIAPVPASMSPVPFARLGVGPPAPGVEPEPPAAGVGVGSAGPVEPKPLPLPTLGSELPPPPPHAASMLNASNPAAIVLRLLRRHINISTANTPAIGSAARRTPADIGDTEPLPAPVVVRRTLTLVGVEPTLTVPGVDTQVAPCGKPAHVIVTVPLYPVVPTSESGIVVFCPARIVAPLTVVLN